MLKLVAFVLLICNPLAVIAATSIGLIEVFIDDTNIGDFLVSKEALDTGIEVKVYNLSGPERFEETLSKGLVGNEQQIKDEVLKRIAELPPTYLDEHVVLPYEGLLKAKEYEIIKIPAIVFNNGESVIYGLTDLQKAIEIRAQVGGKQ